MSVISETPPPIPIARPKRVAVARPKIRLATGPELAERKEPWYKGALVSLAVHGLVLVILAFGFVKFNAKPVGHLDGTLDTGLVGEPPTHLEGLDEPLVIEPEPMASVDTLAPILSDLDDPNGAASGAQATAEGHLEASNGLGAQEVVQGVKVKVGDPQFTLVWDTNADLDLHVFEPGGAHIWFLQPKTNRGGEQDVDDTDGLGPENIYWNSEVTEDGKVITGQGPKGEYRWYVKYYRGIKFGPSPPTHWKVRVKADGKETTHTGLLRKPGDLSKDQTVRIGR